MALDYIVIEENRQSSQMLVHAMTVLFVLNAIFFLRRAQSIVRRQSRVFFFRFKHMFLMPE